MKISTTQLLIMGYLFEFWMMYFMVQHCETTGEVLAGLGIVILVFIGLWRTGIRLSKEVTENRKKKILPRQINISKCVVL